VANIAPAFTAAPSAAGYYYQARLALLESLRFVYGESGIEVAIERFDDVSFEKDGNPLELLQTKHRVTRAGDLSDASADLWKTLRVWSEAVKADPSQPRRTRFALVTTAQAPAGGAASFLRPDGARDPMKAGALLLAAAAASSSKSLKPAFEAFKSLAPEMRQSLLSAIEVIDRVPVLADLEKEIEEKLKLIAPRGKAAAAREQLEGWWWPRICKALQAPASSIPIMEIEAKLDDIREGMKRDALPVEMEHVDPPEAELQALDELTFVRQLRRIGTGEVRIEFAKRDYYRAFTQRSRWTRLNLLFDGEVARYEKTLVEEWQPRFYKMCEELGSKAKAAAVGRAGRELYHWVETEARFPFRTVTSKFLSVGSYHILANDLRVGWHRDFAKNVRTGSEPGDDK
jgi:hypothetical protein